MSQNGAYVRKGLYTIDTVLSKIVDPVGKRRKSSETEVDFDGDQVYMDSDRYLCFREKGISCCECGITGQFFAKESTNRQEPYRFHFNLYAIDSDGIEVLMTKDHVLPVAQGGPNHIDNYHTMCTRCNCEKGNMNDEQWATYKLFKEEHTKKPTEQLTAAHATVVDLIKAMQTNMRAKGLTNNEFNQQDHYKQACIMATCIRRIVDARNGHELKGGQNIWQAPNLKLK